MAAAAVSAEVNTTVENIGARRLHTVRNPFGQRTQAFGASGKPAPRHATGAKPWILGAGDSLDHTCRLRVLQLMERILEDVSYDAGDAEGEVGPGAECVAAWHSALVMLPVFLPVRDICQERFEWWVSVATA